MEKRDWYEVITCRIVTQTQTLRHCGLQLRVENIIGSRVIKIKKTTKTNKRKENKGYGSQAAGRKSLKIILKLKVIYPPLGLRCDLLIQEASRI